MDSSYALAQWRQALRTAVTAPDGGVAATARRRVTQWALVLTGIRSGTLRPGSRTPVQGVPAWVTPEVVRGGFATGRAAADGPLSEYERRLAHAAGLPQERAAVFEHAISQQGMPRLWESLDTGQYDVDVPEAAALLVVAWLVRSGEVDAALAVVEELRPHAQRIRFLPATAAAPAGAEEVVWRETAGTVAAALRTKRPPAPVVRMNDVLDVWNPFADRLLEHWLVVVDDGVLTEPFPAAWLDAGRDLLEAFDRLRARSAPPRRHTSPKENAAVLRLALRRVLDGTGLTAGERGRVAHAVAAMLRRRGAPGSPELAALRARQRAQAVRPTVAALAEVAAGRLASAPADGGIADAAALATPVSDAEAASSGVPTGWPMPRPVRRALLRAQAGTLQELVDGGVITSAELLATMVPQLTAQALAEQYEDAALRDVTARTYGAFRRRRSLLLLDLQQQVRFEELPWVAAVTGRARDTSAARDVARGTFLRLAGEAVQHWPGALLPNALVVELETLAAAADLRVPLVAEIAADIFQGRFARTYADAFEVAAPVVAGSLYARYYRIADGEVDRVRRSATPAEQLSRLCTERAATPGHAWCPACNGMVIEQCQVLTTHNLAALLVAGVSPSSGWQVAAEGAFGRAAVLLTRLEGNRKPNRMLKDIAYAWRQTVFFLAQLDEPAQAEVLRRLRTDAERRSDFARTRLLTLLDDLAHAGDRPPLLGWGHGQHPLLTGPATARHGMGA